MCVYIYTGLINKNAMILAGVVVIPIMLLFFYVVTFIHSICMYAYNGLEDNDFGESSCYSYNTPIPKNRSRASFYLAFEQKADGSKKVDLD